MSTKTCRRRCFLLRWPSGTVTRRKVSEFDVHLETFMRTTNFSCISKNHQHKGECYLIAFVFDSAI